MKKISIDVSKCTGCGQCALTYSFAKVRAFDPRQSHIRVVQWEDLCLSVPVVCQQCSDAACMAACPSDALAFHPVTGAIALDEAACSQCEACVTECTYQVMHLTAAGLPTTCDLCAGAPACVAACYPGALSYAEVEDAAGEPFRPFAQVLNARTIGRCVAAPDDLLARARLNP